MVKTAARASKVDPESTAGVDAFMGKDRARVVFTSLHDLRSREAAFRALVGRWVAAL
ncbi:MAG: hypothetical protein JNL21_40860 [Myxococcales bacterium]|nr:hypothetical protein [Myxococcales bacterium]